VWRSDAGFDDISVHNLHSGATEFDRIPWISYNFQGLGARFGSFGIKSSKFIEIVRFRPKFPDYRSLYL
jgi:hypothetical protein